LRTRTQNVEKVRRWRGTHIILVKSSKNREFLETVHQAKFAIPHTKFFKWKFSISVLQNLLNFAAGWNCTFGTKFTTPTHLKSWNYIIFTSLWYTKCEYDVSSQKYFAKNSKNRILQHFATRPKLQYIKIYFTNGKYFLTYCNFGLVTTDCKILFLVFFAN
jgi:hypothetical protein